MPFIKPKQRALKHLRSLFCRDVLVASKFHKMLTIIEGNIGGTCRAMCASLYYKGPPQSAEDVCGEMVHIIQRNDSSFQR